MSNFWSQFFLIFVGKKKLKTLYVSNRDTSPLDLSLMTLAVPFVYIFISLITVAEFRAKQSTGSWYTATDKL